jgi:hypothetical protein
VGIHIGAWRRRCGEVFEDAVPFVMGGDVD